MECVANTQCDRATQLMFPINVLIVYRCTGGMCPTALNHINVELYVEQYTPLHTQCDGATQLMFPINVRIV